MSLRLLLDEHYPGWLAEALVEAGQDAVAIDPHRIELRGRDDTFVLRAATDEKRIVVTEDVTTFSVAIAQVPDHVGVIYCHHRRFPRTRPGLDRLCGALIQLAESPTVGLGTSPVEWWLAGEGKA